jgi:hypothetical protein
MSRFDREDLSKVRRYSIGDRENKVAVEMFGKPIHGGNVSVLLDSLPHFLKADDLRTVIDRCVECIKAGRRIILMSGAHTLKVGLSPLFIDLLDFYPNIHFASNGAGLIHDLEIAFFGSTSEDVEQNLRDGSFGMVEETARLFSDVLTISDSRDVGLGEAAGILIEREMPEFAEHSLAYKWYSRGCPFTIHLSVGTDIVCQHPEYDGAKAGGGSQIDFRVLCSSLQKISGGGVAINIGSAVMMPEVFLKAITVAKNLNPDFNDFTTANFDMIQHYRPNVNVVARPQVLGAKGLSFTGHHEIMIPLLFAGIKCLSQK